MKIGNVQVMKEMLKHTKSPSQLVVQVPEMKIKRKLYNDDIQGLSGT
jgi:hypothetical protein